MAMYCKWFLPVFLISFLKRKNQESKIFGLWLFCSFLLFVIVIKNRHSRGMRARATLYWSFVKKYSTEVRAQPLSHCTKILEQHGSFLQSECVDLSDVFTDHGSALARSASRSASTEERFSSRLQAMCGAPLCMATLPACWKGFDQT